MLPATISGSATAPTAKQQETTILILQDQQQQHPLSPTLTHPSKQSSIHTDLQTISDRHRNEIISINHQLNLANQKDPSLPSIVSKLATITCTAISSQLSPTKQLAAHRLFNTTTIPVDESINIDKCLLSDTERTQQFSLVDSLFEPSPRHSLSSITHSPSLDASQENTFTTSVTPSVHQLSSYESNSSTLLCDSQNDTSKDDDDDVFTWKPLRTGTTFSNIQLSTTTISDNGNEITTTTTATTAEELLSQPKLIKPSVTRTPKISELTSSSLENDDDNKCSSPAGGNLSLSLSPPVNRRRDMPALRGPYVSL